MATADRRVLPESFLLRILKGVEDLGELKAILYVSYVTEETGARSVSLERLLSIEGTQIMAHERSPEPGRDRIQRALDRAVVNGHLLRLRTHGTARSTTEYLLATPENEDLIGRLEAGDVAAATRLNIDPADTLELYRPNIFALYERYLGPLTPLIAEQLREAERQYPREWMAAAMEQAAGYNRRTWRYVEGILARWEEEGPPRRIRSYERQER
jgi:DNA replication protein